MIESGADQPIQWGFTSTAPKFFVRLEYTDLPTDDPFNDDFDGDGVSNYNEVLQNTDPLSANLDANGLPLDWERFYGVPVGIDATAPAPRGDGLSYLQAFELGLNPNDYYNGQLPQLFIVGGGNQRAVAGSLLPQPISIAVNYYGDQNAPLTFTASGGALLAPTPAALSARRRRSTCVPPARSTYTAIRPT